jgi:hypothetical protein
MITGVRINPQRAKVLESKAFDISIKAGRFITEPKLVNFLIDNYLDHIELDSSGNLILSFSGVNNAK